MRVYENICSVDASESTLYILYNRYISFNPRMCVCVCVRICGAQFEAPACTRLYTRVFQTRCHASREIFSQYVPSFFD